MVPIPPLSHGTVTMGDDTPVPALQIATPYLPIDAPRVLESVTVDVPDTEDVGGAATVQGTEALAGFVVGDEEDVGYDPELLDPGHPWLGRAAQSGEPSAGGAPRRSGRARQPPAVLRMGDFRRESDRVWTTVGNVVRQRRDDSTSVFEDVVITSHGQSGTAVVSIPAQVLARQGANVTVLVDCDIDNALLLEWAARPENDGVLVSHQEAVLRSFDPAGIFGVYNYEGALVGEAPRPDWHSGNICVIDTQVPGASIGVCVPPAELRADGDDGDDTDTIATLQDARRNAASQTQQRLGYLPDAVEPLFTHSPAEDTRSVGDDSASEASANEDGDSAHENSGDESGGAHGGDPQPAGPGDA